MKKKQPVEWKWYHRILLGRYYKQLKSLEDYLKNEKNKEIQIND